jgi:hypothetical protein
MSQLDDLHLRASSMAFPEFCFRSLISFRFGPLLYLTFKEITPHRTYPDWLFLLFACND